MCSRSGSAYVRTKKGIKTKLRMLDTILCKKTFWIKINFAIKDNTRCIRTYGIDVNRLLETAQNAGIFFIN